MYIYIKIWQANILHMIISYDWSTKISTFVHGLFYLLILLFFAVGISYFNDFILSYRRGSKWD